MLVDLHLFLDYSLKMQKLQRPWSEISVELQRCVRESGLTYKQLSEQAVIDYFAARRIINGHLKNRTDAATTVCSFFKIDLFYPDKMQSNAGKEILDAITAIWDGTDAHAQLLVKLIEGTARFKVEAYHKK